MPQSSITQTNTHLIRERKVSGVEMLKYPVPLGVPQVLPVTSNSSMAEDNNHYLTSNNINFYDQQKNIKV